MKITTTHKAPNAKSVTQIIFSEGQQVKFIEQKDGTQILSVGAGKYKELNLRTFRTLVRSLVRNAQTYKIQALALSLTNPVFEKMSSTLSPSELASTVVENLILADYEFDTYKSKERTNRLKEVTFVGAAKKGWDEGVKRGLVVGEYTNLCRDIANTPGGEMTPQLLAERAKKASKGLKIKVTVFDDKRLQKEKMGAILGVGKGSKFGPRFIIMEYYGASKSDRPIVFAGKGITFDTGGLNVKPGDSMLDMHLDMSGGAAVIAAVSAAAKLGLKKNVIGLIPAAENSISGESFRPGDVLTSLSGKTIDVLNTDAEGRVVLADALTYAKRYNPKLVVDIATLTGASIIALGDHASALLTRDDTARERLMALAEESGEYLWPLPMWDEYKQYTKGRFGDVANIPASGNTRSGGVINGAMFLLHFTEDYPKDCAWAHIDMAPRMTSNQSDKLAKGATGEPTRLLIKIIESY